MIDIEITFINSFQHSVIKAAEIMDWYIIQATS